MPKLEIKNTSGKAVGSIDLDDAVFGAEIHEHLLWETVKWQLAKRRAGTASTKRIGEVRGSSIKAWKQKGTGRARQGTKRAPHWVGGSSVFGRVSVRDVLGRTPSRVPNADQDTVTTAFLHCPHAPADARGIADTGVDLLSREISRPTHTPERLVLYDNRASVPKRDTANVSFSKSRLANPDSESCNPARVGEK